MSDISDTMGFKDLTAHKPAPDQDEDYLAWKIEKIETALKEAEDRSAMIPFKKVWERFGFEN